MESMGGVKRSVVTTLANAAEALAGVEPLADPLFATTILTARAELGLSADPLPLLRFWTRSARSQVGRTRYRWTISTWPPLGAVAHVPDRQDWIPWRPGDAAVIDQFRPAFEERLMTPLVIAEVIDWLSNVAADGSQASELASQFLSECRATARRDAAAYAQELHAWGDTWALHCFASRPPVLRLLHPFALAIAEAYADTTIQAGREAVHGTRFPFAGVPLVSASAHLASGCRELGIHPKLTGTLSSWIEGQQQPDGGFGDGDGPSDVMTTLAASQLLAGLDPGWDPSAAIAFLASRQASDGWSRAYGPETAWMTLAVYRCLERSSRHFADRFEWPEVAVTSRDRRTGLPRYDYYADLARLCQEVSGLGRAPMEVAFIDLAGFGAFNNRHGMAMGDAVLREFAQALAAIPGLMAIRDGGDEFLAVGAPSGSGLAAQLDRFRREWPSRLRARFGDDAGVSPRILVTSTTGGELVATRDDLGRRIAALKLADPPEGLPAEGVLVDETMATRER
jgi:GGDEF domain-containing protein